MKSNFSIRLFNELIGKGYKVNDASNDSGDVLEVQVYLDRFDALLWVTLFVSDDDENQTLGQIFVRNIKSISSEKRIQALEYINAINRRFYLLPRDGHLHRTNILIDSCLN